MCPLVAYISDLEGHGFRQLALHGNVVGIERGQAHLERTRAGENLIRQWQQAVAGNRRCSLCRRPNRQRSYVCRVVTDAENGPRRGGSIIVLSQQHRQVLGHSVTKDRTEDANVIASPVTNPHHGLGV